MKCYKDYDHGTYENYLAYHHIVKSTALHNILVNGVNAQTVEFFTSEHPDGTVRNFIRIVLRSKVRNYRGTRLWIEEVYCVEKDEGNKIYLDAKRTKKIDNDAIRTYGIENE